MKTAFFGTPDFAVPCLDVLASKTDVRMVVTGPDARRGRGRNRRPPPVKVAAMEHGLRVVQPFTLREPGFIDSFRAMDLDLAVVVAYGRLLGRRLLRAPSMGIVNVHASLLPLLRGAAPIQRAIMEGHTRSGVCVMKMVFELDAGPVYMRRALDLDPRETAGTLHDRLSVLGAELLGEFLDRAMAGDVPEPVEQDHSKATYAEKIGPSDEWIDWRDSAAHIDRRVRGLFPRPGACTEFRGKRLRLLEAVPCERDFEAGDPGTVIVAEKSLFVRCGAGLLELRRLQVQGRKAVSGSDFANGYRLGVDERFSTP